ncbi:MAG: succinate dehydrogenase, cytochrome b556 subunit [Hyphomonadaceae bacterium]
MSQGGWTDKRPMSPHIWQWRWHVTMLGSILHRVTGVGNYIGAILAVGWLFAAASGRETYDKFADIMATPLGQLVLFGFTLSVCYHLINGLRHLVLDSGAGFEPKSASVTAWVVLVLSVVAAAAVWIFAGLVPGLSVGG